MLVASGQNHMASFGSTVRSIWCIRIWWVSTYLVMAPWHNNPKLSEGKTHGMNILLGHKGSGSIEDLHFITGFPFVFIILPLNEIQTMVPNKFSCYLHSPFTYAYCERGGPVWVRTIPHRVRRGDRRMSFRSSHSAVKRLQTSRLRFTLSPEFTSESLKTGE